jgi:hypothetical protein
MTISDSFFIMLTQLKSCYIMYRHHKEKNNLPRGAWMTLQHSCLWWGVHVTGLQGQLILLRCRVGLQLEPVPAFAPLRGSLKQSIVDYNKLHRKASVFT